MANSTRPKLAYITGTLAVANQRPTKRHWALMKSVLRYIAHTPTLGIQYSRNKGVNGTKGVAIYSDADFANDPDDRESMTGTEILIPDAPIQWKSKKQSMKAQSIIEAEYIAMAATLQKGCYKMRLIKQFFPELTKDTCLHVDNQPKMDMVKTIGETKRRKFIDLRHATIRYNLKRYAKNFSTYHPSYSAPTA